LADAATDVALADPGWTIRIVAPFLTLESPLSRTSWYMAGSTATLGVLECLELSLKPDVELCVCCTLTTVGGDTIFFGG